MTYNRNFYKMCQNEKYQVDKCPKKNNTKDIRDLVKIYSEIFYKFINNEAFNVRLSNNSLA